MIVDAFPEVGAEVRARCNAAGWPRPYADYLDEDDGRVLGRLPVPWVAGVLAAEGDWGAYRSDAVTAAFEQRLCAICGERVDGPLYLGLGDPDPRRRRTSGAGCCARCLQVAVRFCPHLAELAAAGPDAVIGWIYDGDGNGLRRATGFGDEEIDDDAVPVTVAELRALVRAETLTRMGQRATRTQPTASASTPA